MDSTTRQAFVLLFTLAGLVAAFALLMLTGWGEALARWIDAAPTGVDRLSDDVGRLRR